VPAQRGGDGPNEDAELGVRAAIERNLLTVLGGPVVEVLEEPVGD
jgi:[protein-PII] uridylyltransferase